MRARRLDVKASNSERIDLHLSYDVFGAGRLGKPAASVCFVVHDARLRCCVADRGTELRQEFYSVAFRRDSDSCQHYCLSRGLVALSVAISLQEEAIEVVRVPILVPAVSPPFRTELQFRAISKSPTIRPRRESG